MNSFIIFNFLKTSLCVYIYILIKISVFINLYIFAIATSFQNPGFATSLTGWWCFGISISYLKFLCFMFPFFTCLSSRWTQVWFVNLWNNGREKMKIQFLCLWKLLRTLFCMSLEEWRNKVTCMVIAPGKLSGTQNSSFSIASLSLNFF